MNTQVDLDEVEIWEAMTESTTWISVLDELAGRGAWTVRSVGGPNGNKRIQVFDAEGTFKREFGNVGTPLTMCMTRGATQHLYIVNPIKSIESRAKSMWDTHPPLAERIGVLRGLAGQFGQDPGLIESRTG